METRAYDMGMWMDGCRRCGCMGMRVYGDEGVWYGDEGVWYGDEGVWYGDEGVWG